MRGTDLSSVLLYYYGDSRAVHTHRTINVFRRRYVMPLLRSPIHVLYNAQRDSAHLNTIIIIPPSHSRLVCFFLFFLHLIFRLIVCVSQETTVAGWGHDDAMRFTDGLLALLWVIAAIAVTAKTPRAAAATCPPSSDTVRRCKCSSRDNEIQIWWVCLLRQCGFASSL